MLSRMISHRPSPKYHDQALQWQHRPRWVGTDRPADARNDELGIADGSQRDECHAGVEALHETLAHGHRQARLTDPTGPGERHQPHAGPPDQLSQLADGGVPPEQGGRLDWQRPSATMRRGHRRNGLGGARRGSGGGEPLAQQKGQIVAGQPAQLSRRTERPIRIRSRLSDTRQQLDEPGFAIGRRHLHVQQPRQPSRQLELVLQTGDLHARADPPVTLPVHADEDVALRQVGAIHLTRWVRPGAELEHHRGQPQRRDRPRDGPPLLCQLPQGRTHEDPQPLVRSPDDRLPRRHAAHRPPPARITTPVSNNRTRPRKAPPPLVAL